MEGGKGSFFYDPSPKQAHNFFGRQPAKVAAAPA
jgi:hypothetical protein